MDKITVIIPVYKVEPFLRQCLDSVVNQTYRNLEIIVVDDGSPDNCGTICDEYAARDSRIRVIHQENRGLSAARNIALKYVTGEWISFVDSDDWCKLDLYEKAVKEAAESQADIVIFSHFRNTPPKEEEIHAFNREFETSDRNIIFQIQLGVLSGRYAPYSPAQPWIQGYPWDKLYKASLILNNALCFAENVRADEDLILNIHAFQYAQKIKFFDQALYHWRVNPASIGHKYTPDRSEVDKEIYAEMFRIGEKYQLPEKYYNAINTRIVDNTMRLGIRCFFCPEREGALPAKIKYATEVLHSEPFYTAYEKVDKKKLGEVGKFITIAHSGFLLYIATTYLRLFKK